VEEAKELLQPETNLPHQKFKMKKETKKLKIEAAKKGRASWKKRLNSLNN